VATPCKPPLLEIECSILTDSLSAMPISLKTRYWLSWILAGAAASIYLFFSWHHFDDPQRRDGNRGHTFIDFGGQYLLGRMVVRGQGKHLYHRSYQREVLHEAYPAENESPMQEIGDAEQLMEWLMGPGDSEEEQKGPVGGPLYPPTHAFWFSPLGCLPPHTAYRALQILIVFGAFSAGFGLSLLAHGRWWWPLASLAVILFPGFAGCLGLGQNSVLSLNILIWGWVLISQNRPGWGGLVWGLLAFKPQWAAAFFLVPLWMGRWRVAGCMLASGIVQAMLTLPVVGWNSWTDWLQIVGEGARISQSDEIWTLRSRDLFTLPRRFLDFESPAPNFQAVIAANLVGWALWLIVVGMTTTIAVWQRRKTIALTGVTPAFFLFAAWLSCLHFMYYDVLLVILPVFLLYLWPRFPPWPCHLLIAVLFCAPTIAASKLGEPPIETLCVLGLWGLSGWIWIKRDRESEKEP
jgi:arabinofuranan 3-O-arabinosyltransferase